MVRHHKTEGPIGRVLDAYAHCDQSFRNSALVIAHLERRFSPGKVQAVVGRPGQAHCLAEPARAGSQLPGQLCGRNAFNGDTAVIGHPVRSCHGLQSAEKDAAGSSFDFTTNVHAEIASIDCIHIGVSSGTKKNLVAWRWAAMRVGRRVGRIVVRSKIGFDLDDAAV